MELECSSLDILTLLASASLLPRYHQAPPLSGHRCLSAAMTVCFAQAWPENLSKVQGPRLFLEEHQAKWSIPVPNEAVRHANARGEFGTGANNPCNYGLGAKVLGPNTGFLSTTACPSTRGFHFSRCKVHAQPRDISGLPDNMIEQTHVAMSPHGHGSKSRTPSEHPNH